MGDIYSNINAEDDIVLKIQSDDTSGTDEIEERNTFPNPVDEDKDISLPQDAPRTTVDFYQTHEHGEDFGTTNGVLSFYDPTNPDRQLFDIIEQEAIELSSPPMKLYILVRSDVDIDCVYGEAVIRDGFLEPITVFGDYEDPTPIQILEKFGIDEQESLDIQFNLNYIINKIGVIDTEANPVPMGSYVITYDNKVWEVMSSIIIDESLWRAQHLNVKVIRVQPDGVVLPDFQEGLQRYPVVGENTLKDK
jgi:hypothetical protein